MFEHSTTIPIWIEKHGIHQTRPLDMHYFLGNQMIGMRQNDKDKEIIMKTGLNKI